MTRKQEVHAGVDGGEKQKRVQRDGERRASRGRPQSLGALRGASVQGVFVLAPCRGQQLTVCCPAGLFLLVGEVNKVKV